MNSMNHGDLIKSEYVWDLRIFKNLLSAKDTYSFIGKKQNMKQGSLGLIWKPTRFNTYQPIGYNRIMFH